jgi:hypothetical protein
MVFVSDDIPREVRRVVEFLNDQMNPAEVITIEVEQYVATDGSKTLVPRVIGETAGHQADAGSGTSTRSSPNCGRSRGAVQTSEGTPPFDDEHNRRELLRRLNEMLGVSGH